MAVFPLPRAPSRKAAGNRLVFSFRLVRPCELGVFSCFGVMVTAADRAAATCQRRGTKVFLYSIVCIRKPPMAKGHRRLSICRSPPPRVRGGSVSRRGLTQLHRRAPPLRRNQPRRNIPLKRQPLFGREGSGGRGASLREAASPPSRSPSPTQPLREGAWGRGFSQRSPSPRVSPKTNIARGEPRATF